MNIAESNVTMMSAKIARRGVFAMNKVNLKLLAGWLLANHESLVETKAFDMKDYRSTESSSCDFVSDTNCGTVGCALGWAPATGIKALAALEEDYYKYGHSPRTLSFSMYCDRVFELKTCSAYWDWCFADEWVDGDNTPKGSAIRIMYLLNHEEEVTDWGRGLRYFGKGVVRGYMSWWEKEGKFL